MFSRTIFKQTLKANLKLWLIFTAIMCVLSTVIIAVFDPKMISSMMDMMKDTPMADMVGDQMDGLSSLLGMLSQSFYSMQGIILPLIFIIMTANSLIASQVDRGSMAYLLSTPTKRSTVVRTQALYLITSIFMMFLVITVSGILSVQIFQGGIFGKAYTDDIKAASSVLELDKKDVDDNLNLILGDEEALEAGAEARDIKQDVYVEYLNLKIAKNAYQSAADILGIEVDEVTKDPTLIKTNENALTAAADILGINEAEYSAYLDQLAISMQPPASSDSSASMQKNMMAGLTAASELLGIDVADLASDMSLIKANSAALNAAASAAGIQPELFVGIINQQLASDELTSDEGIEFNLKSYLLLNLGGFLLMFATSSISFLFSCIFNLSKNSLALGAGIPIAFFIFQIMAQVGDSLEGFKYLSLNTLYDTRTIISGGNVLMPFIVLAAAGILLYMLAARWFKEKDLPL